MPLKFSANGTMPTIIDIEASGFGHSSYPIEIGLALSCGSRYCTLIKPESNWTHWDRDAQALHGIDRDQLVACGKPIELVCQELNDLLDASRIYTDAWVVDKPWLNRLYECSSLSPSFFVSPIESIQSECQHNIWDEIRAEVLQSSLRGPRHRASADALLIQQVYLKTQNRCLIDVGGE